MHSIVLMATQRKLNLPIQEKQLLWATLSDDHEYQYTLALNIYRSLFDLIPEAEEIFPASMHPNSPDASKSPEFQRMALYLIRTLWLAVKNVDHPEQQIEMLHGIGKCTLIGSKFDTRLHYLTF